jgi:catecholate siderophore receptor
MSAGIPQFKKTPLAAALLMLGTLPLSAQATGNNADGGTAGVNIAANTESVELEAVQVNGRRPDDFKPDYANVGSKPEAALRDIPQSVTVINRAVLNAQNATTLTDALRNVPGITLSGGEGGAIGDNINLRGFTARTDIYLDGARDRAQYRRDTFELESVEVLKGPSSLFFGRGSTGGVINQVTKAPTLKPGYEITGSIGSDDYYRSTIDINQPFAEHAAFRLSAVGQNVSSTRDVIQNKDYGFAPSLSLGIGTDTRLTLNGLVLRNDDVPDYGIPFLNGRPAPVSKNRFYGDTDDFFTQDVNVFRARLDHNFNGWLTLRDAALASQTDTDARPTPYRVCTAAFNTPAAPCPVSAIGTPLDQITVQSDRRDRELQDSALFNQLDLIAKFDTGPIAHTLVVGNEVGLDTSRNQAFANTPRETDSLGNFTPGPTPAGTARSRTTYTKTRGYTFALYANDIVALTKQLKLVGGLRWDRYKATSDGRTTVTNAATTFQRGRTDYATSVRGGVIWQPDAVQSYYVSYGTSFNPSAETVTLSAAQQAVSPEKNRSYEIGAKFELLHDALSLNTAAFVVEKTDARTTDATTGTVTLDGDTEVKGFEIGAVGRLSEHWQLIGGYTFLDGKLKRTRDANQGNELANTPKNAASLFTTYRFLRDFEAGVGVYYIDKRYVNTANTGSVDAYVRTDFTLAYRRPQYDLQLNLQNAFDESYSESIVASENGRAVPGRGRTLIGSVIYRF